MSSYTPTHLRLHEHYGAHDFAAFDEEEIDRCIRSLTLTTGKNLATHWWAEANNPEALVGLENRRLYAWHHLLICSRLERNPEMELGYVYRKIPAAWQFSIGFAPHEDHLVYVKLIAQHFPAAKWFIDRAVARHADQNRRSFWNWLRKRPWTIDDVEYAELIGVARDCCRLTVPMKEITE